MAYVTTLRAPSQPLSVLGTEEAEQGVTQHYIGSRELEIGETQVRILPGVLTVNWPAIALAIGVVVGVYLVWKNVFSESGRERLNEMAARWAMES